jgi:hypothetical protein
VSEADKSLTLRFEGALNPNNEGIEAKFAVSLSGDEMKMSGAQEIYGPRTGQFLPPSLATGMEELASRPDVKARNRNVST